MSKCLLISLGITAAAFAAPPCTFTVTPSPAFVDSAAQTLAFQVTASVQGCAWTAGSAGFATLLGSGAAGDGTANYSITQNSTGSARSVNLTIAGQTVSLQQDATQTIFSDVFPSDFYFDAAGLLRQNLITAGCATQPALQYCPSANVTRGQMAIFVLRAIMGGGPNADNFPFTTAPYFNDVPSSHPYFKWIQKLKDLGITGGCTLTNYCPDNPVTRGQMAVFIIRARYGASTAFTFSSSPFFTDVAADHPFFKWIQKIKQAGISAGCSGSQYCPGDPVTRGQMALFIMRGGFNQFLPAATPVITNLTPNFGTAGQSVAVAITGQNTNFVPGTTQVTAGAGIVVSNISVSSSTNLSAQFAISSSAAVGPGSVIVQTGPEEAARPNAFTVNAAIPPMSAVTIDSFAFAPTPDNVSTGTQVTWTNAQPNVVHTVTADDGSFGSGDLSTNSTFNMTFNAPGTYNYHCTKHPFMKGQIVVQ